IALGRFDEAVQQIEKSLAVAQSTGSLKYIAKAHALRGGVALATGQLLEAEAELTEGLAVAQRIGYPTLTWQCAHALSKVLAARAEQDRGARDAMDQAREMVRLAVDTIKSVADRLTDPALARSFLAWGRVEAVHVDLDRLRSA